MQQLSQPKSKQPTINHNSFEIFLFDNNKSKIFAVETQDNSQSQKKVCRICLEQLQQFVIPCKCGGSIAHVHQQCIKEYIYTKMQKKIFTKLNDFIRINCQICNRQILFEYAIQSKVNCNPCRNTEKTQLWITLLILLIVFSVLFGIFIIIIIAYYASFAYSQIIQIDSKTIYIILGITPILGIALSFIVYYFIGQNLYGIIRITRVKNKSEPKKPVSNHETLFNFERYIIEK